ncbi:MAG: type I-E CRISPR-associated protein Cas6/Cse3/CasE [Mailhella sp.]|nr:type I-E CRISPR-associated protein Cas6/Cse3/CasE [Mailhella sp.]
MSWLARIIIPAKDALRLGLTDNERWHKFSWQCFPGSPDAPRDFLTRLDTMAGEMRLYVLAEREPERPAACLPEWWACRPVAPAFLEHDAYRFSLRANPTKKVTAFHANGEPKKNSRKVAVTGREEQREWLGRKGRQYGFAIDDAAPLVISAAANHVFYRGGNAVLHVGVDFQGVLRVTDRDLFKTAFQRGLGSSKAFGFGMLLLQPII